MARGLQTFLDPRSLVSSAPDAVDCDLNTAAALAIEPAVRPTGGQDRPVSKDAGGGDSFAKVLDAEMDAAGETAPAAQPAPAAAAATTSVKPAVSVITVDQQAAVAANGAGPAFATVLANVAPAGASPVNAGDAVVADPATAQAVVVSPTNPAPPAQTAAVAALLVVSGGAAFEGEGQATVGEGETAEDTSTDGEASAVAILAGITAPVAATPVVAEGPARTTAPVGQGGATPALPTDVDAGAAQTADASASPSQAPEGREQRAASAPQGAAQPATAQAQKPAAIVVEAAAKDAVAAPAATSPAPQASVAVQPTGEAARVAATPPALQSAPAATVQVYTRIIERADGRAQRFEVRLDPAELGRVDVRIEIGADRKVHAVLAAHDSAALSDLVRGQRALERALSGAGIDLADNGVRFELASDGGRGNASQQQASDGNGRSGQANVWRNFDAVTIPVSEETAAATVNNSWRPQRLDLVA